MRLIKEEGAYRLLSSMIFNPTNCYGQKNTIIKIFKILNGKDSQNYRLIEDTLGSV
jgi:hypothetical protein